jgi:hypothetical protein
VLCQISFTGSGGMSVEIKHLGFPYRLSFYHAWPVPQNPGGHGYTPSLDPPVPSRSQFRNLLIKLYLIGRRRPVFDIGEGFGPQPKCLQHGILMLRHQHSNRSFG